jgi:hypothetical protein
MQKLIQLNDARAEQLREAGITISQPFVRAMENGELVYLYQYSEQLEILFIVIDHRNGYLPSLAAQTSRGEMAQFEDTVFAIAENMEYSPIVCESTPTP